jgi:chemotaxis protein methyltransferase CheR
VSKDRTKSSGHSAREIEIGLFAEGIATQYGYDFREYAQSSFSRRVEATTRQLGFRDPLALLSRVLRDPDLFKKVLALLTVPASDMFRDPQVFLALRREVLPLLSTFPSLNIWIAGCSTGEEAYSLAILLFEEGLLDRATLFATDINFQALERAREGIYDARKLPAYKHNYHASGGESNFGHYYSLDYGLIRMRSFLREKISFFEHNLATDDVFAECHLILCRNVLIYFGVDLQLRVTKLFSRALRHGGILCIGPKETLRLEGVARDLQDFDRTYRIFRKTTPLLRARSRREVSHVAH